MNPKVSIIMTVYNHEAFVVEAIESVRAQTFRDWELIIWDDGSSDRSFQMVQAYAKDPRIRVFNASHQGRIGALQSAFKAARGIFLGWMDSDDQLAKQALEQTVAILDQKPEFGLVYSDYVERVADKPFRYGHRCKVPYSEATLLTDFITFHFRLFRRDLFEQAGQMDDTVPFAEDYDFCLRMSEVTSFYHLQKPLYIYRIHQGCTSLRYQLEQIKGTQEAISRALQRRGLSNKYEVALYLQGHYSIRRKEETS